MSKRINARSPYYTATNVTVGQEVELDLYIWSGFESLYVDDIDSIDSRTYAGYYVSLVFGGTTVDVTVNDPSYVGYAGFQFQVTPTSGTYIVEAYKDDVLFQTHDNITVDGSGYFSVTTTQMTTGTYTFKLYYNNNPTTATFTQLSGGYAYASGGNVAGFTSAPTSISQTISYTYARPSNPVFSEIRTATTKDNGFMKFEISELIRDYLVTEYGNYSTDVVWVQWSVVKDGGTPTFSSAYTACDGYGYFEEGSNPELSNQLLISNTSIYYNDGSDIVFPIWAEDLSTITIQSTAGANIDWGSADIFWETEGSSWGFAYTPVQIVDNGNTNQKIQYIIITNTDQLADKDTVTITSTTGGPTTVLSLIKICEPKYSPVNVIFYNKFGALQNMWFFKKNVASIDVQGDSYKANTLGSGVPVSYSTTSHQKQSFNVNGNEKLKLNSGFYDEEYNEIVRQMLLSEQVWVDNGDQVLPVIPVTSSYTFQTHVNDKLINHMLDFEYAYDKINNIR